MPCGPAALEEPGYWVRYLRAKKPWLALWTASASNGAGAVFKDDGTSKAIQPTLTNARDWHVPLTVTRDLGFAFDNYNAATSMHRLARSVSRGQAYYTCTSGFPASLLTDPTHAYQCCKVLDQ